MLTTLIAAAMLTVTPLPNPASAAAAAWTDLQTLPADDQPWQQYLWVPAGDDETQTAAVFALNAAVSRSARLYRPVVVANGQLLRIDLRSLAPSTGEVDQGLADLLERYQRLGDSDPYFHVREAVKVLVTVPAYRTTDGKTYTQRWQVVEASAPAPHLGDAGQQLFATCGNAAILRADWFVRFTLSTLDGGAYYDLIGARVATRAGETQQEAYLRSRGVNLDALRNLSASQRSIRVRSEITGKPRQLEILYAASVAPGRGTGLVAITHDTGDGDVRAANDPIRNLLAFEDRAREIILERPNGMQEYTLFNAAGQLQNDAPPDVATDHLIPPPHTKRLQAGISCIRCHGKGDRAGWIPAPNDVRRLLQSELDLYGDLQSRDGYFATLQKLVSIYDGEFDLPLMRARDTYSDAVLRVTGGKTVEQASAIVASVWERYEYDLVTPAIALAEIGVHVEPHAAVATLKALLPRLPVADDGISPEDPILGLLKADMPVNRRQWEAVFADAAIRAQVAIAQRAQQLQEE